MTLLGGYAKPSKYAQQQVDELLPQGATFANPETERNRPQRIVATLVEAYKQDQAIATDPATLPQDRTKVVQHMRQVKMLIDKWAAASAPAAAGAPPEAAPVPTATNPTTGQKLYFRNGQWGPQ